MPYSNFPNGITSFGAPVFGGIPPTFGKYFFVDYATGLDSNSGTSTNKPLKTLSAAYAKARSNKNDVIVINGYSTVVETAMITWAKNRIHVIGLNGPPNPYGYGCGAKVQLGITGVATNLATLLVTGVRNTFTGIKFINADTVAQGLYSVIDAGEYTRFFGCEIYKSSLLSTTGAAELVCNADSSVYVGCTIGSIANAITGTIIRPNVLFTKGIVTGKVARDVSFLNCNFWRRSSHVNNRFMYGANATDIERQCLIENCKFWNAKNSSAVPAQNVAFGSSLTVGEVLINNCVAQNAATAMSTTTGVFVNGPVPAADTTGISLQGT